MNCKKCNCTYFVQLPAMRLGDEFRSFSLPATQQGEAFIVTICAACGLSAPLPVSNGAHNPYMTEYANFIKEIKTCQDKINGK